MGQLEFKARIVAPYFTEIPLEIKEGWLSGSKKAASKTYKGLKKAIKTRKDFEEKIARPTEKAIASFIDPKWSSKRGLTYEDIINKTRDSLVGAEKRYFKARKTVYESGKFEEKLEYGQKEYARKWCEYLGPLKGYAEGKVKGLSALGVMALCADPELKKFLKERIDTIEGIPCRAVIEKPRRFRNILANRIVHWGSEIIKLGYEEQDIKRANQELNQLVNEYRCEGIVPFTSGGASSRLGRDSAVASHIDFIVVEIPDPHTKYFGVGADPTNTNKKKKWLGLEIQVVARH